MKKFALYAIATVVLFAISAGASLWLQTHNKDTPGDKGHANARSGYRPEGEGKVIRPGNNSEREKPSAEEKASSDKDAQTLMKLQLLNEELRKERSRVEAMRKQVQDELREVTRLSSSLPPAVRSADYSTLQDNSIKPQVPVPQVPPPPLKMVNGFDR